MTAFTFDAQAALERAKKGQAIPNPPNRPNRSASAGAGLGGLGGLGAVRASHPEMKPAELARDAFEERAAIRQFDGRQDRATAEREALEEARRPASITWLDEWRANTNDPYHPEAWR